jgi:NSS family neurotransmitter:Na+ symporter
MENMDNQREKWGSKIGFILAASGSAIGLGNIWRFPYVVGENGGAAFIFIYLVCVALIGLPVIMGEVLIGRSGQRNPVGSFKALTKSKFWPLVGGMGIIGGFIILSYYAVVAGWSVGYIYEAIAGNFYEFNTPTSAADHFNDLNANVFWIVGMFVGFMILTMVIVFFGVQKGIERGSKIMMPALLLLLLIVMVKGITMEGSEAGLTFLFKPDWSKISGLTILEALGQAFFTLSLGMGAMLTYGSYMSEKDSVPSSSIQIVFLDTTIAIIAGIAIFTAVFSTGMNPSSGEGLIFHTLPVVFTKMIGGYVFSILFFILLTIAAITSAISLMEVVTAYFVDEKKWKRHNAVIVFGTATILFGIPSALSFNILSEWTIFGLNYFELLIYITANIMLPLGGFLIAVFIAYVWGLDKAVIDLKKGAENLFQNYVWILKVWRLIIKYLAPILILIVLLHSLGLLSNIIDLITGT